MLRLEQKKMAITELTDIANKTISVVAADYRGLTVAEMTALRSDARKEQVTVCVVRNRLAKRALQDTAAACLQDSLVGPVLLAFTQEDPGAAARICKRFAKAHENFNVTAVALEGKLLPSSQLDVVASLPTREQAIATVMSVMQAPIVKFVRTLVEPHAKLVRMFAAIRDKKQAGQKEAG